MATEEILKLENELEELSQEEELLTRQRLEDLRQKVEEKRKVVQALKGSTDDRKTAIESRSLTGDSKDDCLSKETEEWRFIVIGKTGNGKSSSVNTVIGKNICPARCSSMSVTKKCQLVEETAHGKRLIIVDTPGLFDTDVPVAETLREFGKIAGMTAPGFHAFIVVFSVGRFTKEEIQSVEILTKLFGSKLYDRTVVLFTGVDNLEADGISFEGFIGSLKHELKTFIQRCGNRVVGFNNRNAHDDRQVEHLLDKIGDVVEMQGNSYYTNEMYQAAARAFEEEQMRRREAGNTESDVEIRRGIRQDLAEESSNTEKLLHVIIDIVAPFAANLIKTGVKKAGEAIASRCSLS